MRRAVAETVEAIPAQERAEHATSVETTLLEHARTSDPRTVRLLGQRILAHLDPDGPSPEEQRLQQTHRRVSLTRLPDGTGLLEGRFVPDLPGDLGRHPHPTGRPPTRRRARRRHPQPGDSGCTTPSKKPAGDSWQPATSRITPAYPPS